MIALDRLAELVDVGIREIADAKVRAHSGGRQNLAGDCAADPVNVGQPDLDLLVAREIDARDTSHYQPCRCLCLGLRLQMMRVTPFRLMTLQCSQIGFTLLRTFTSELRTDV